MSKALFFNIPAHGHVNPSLPVVAELVRRGEQVVCANTEEFRKSIESTRAQFAPYPDMTALETLMAQAGEGNLARNALRLVQIGEAMIPFVLELIEREKPDYLIYDSLAGWGEIAARLKHLPSVALLSTFALNPKSPPPMPLSSILKLAGGFARVMPEYWRTARRIRQKFGASYNSLINSLMNTAQLNIVFTSDVLQPGADKFDSSYKFVGVSLQPRASDTAFPFDALKKHPVVYISMGTINNQNLGFYRACFAAFANHPGQFILSAGKKTDIAALGAIPANFIVRNYVPQLEVLQKVDAFVTHGGLNSVQEGLYYNVPLVVLPQQMEQALVAQQVVFMGAGVMAGSQSGQVTAAELRQAVDRLLANLDRYKAAAKRPGESLRDAGGYVRAADEIQAFIKSR